MNFFDAVDKKCGIERKEVKSEMKPFQPKPHGSSSRKPAHAEQVVNLDRNSNASTSTSEPDYEYVRLNKEKMEAKIRRSNSQVNQHVFAQFNCITLNKRAITF
jgi:hypothetical protein